MRRILHPPVLKGRRLLAAGVSPPLAVRAESRADQVTAHEMLAVTARKARISLEASVWIDGTEDISCPSQNYTHPYISITLEHTLRAIV